MGLHHKAKAATQHIEGKVQAVAADLTDNSGHLALPLNGTI